MGIFDRLKTPLSFGVSSAFSHVFAFWGSKAVDVTSALKRAMDDHVQIRTAQSHRITSPFVWRLRT